jgi:hypothetical protein
MATTIQNVYRTRREDDGKPKRQSTATATPQKRVEQNDTNVIKMPVK